MCDIDHTSGEKPLGKAKADLQSLPACDDNIKERHLSPHEGADVMHREQLLDEALRQTFPASDPVSLSPDEVAFLL